MNWEAIGAVGEIIGAFAVLATLIYLAMQVRQSREMLERNEKLALSNTYQQRASLRSDTVRAVIESDHLAPILAKVVGKPEAVDELSEEEKVRLRAYITTQQIMLDNLIFQTHLGQLEMHDEAAETENNILNTYRRMEPMIQRLGGPNPPPRFRAWLKDQDPEL